MKGQRRKKIKWTGWSMVLAASLFVLIFSYIPMIQAFVLSLQTGKGANLKFAGFDNYIRMVRQHFLGNIRKYIVLCGGTDSDYDFACACDGGFVK